MRPSSSCRARVSLGLFFGGMSLLAIATAAAQLPPDEAVRFFEQRVKADPEDFIAWNRLGDLALTRYRV